MVPRDLGAAEIHHVRLVHGRKETRATLPFTAWGLSREVLDEHLLARAAEAGALIRRGVAVRRLQGRAGAWRAALADGTARETPAVLLATGKHDLRGHQRAPTTGGDGIGFKMHWRLTGAQAAALAGHIELVWFEGGYAGLQPVEHGHANLCLVLRSAAYGRLGKSWCRLLAALTKAAPHLGSRLDGAQPLWLRPVTIAGMPYGHVHSDTDGDPHLYRLGDQFAVIPSFTGEGMALALRTARLAAAAIRAREPAAAYHRAARREVIGTMRRARSIERIAGHRLGRRLLVPVGQLPGVVPVLARATRLPGARPDLTTAAGLSSPGRAARA